MGNMAKLSVYVQEAGVLSNIGSNILGSCKLSLPTLHHVGLDHVDGVVVLINMLGLEHQAGGGQDKLLDGLGPHAVQL